MMFPCYSSHKKEADDSHRINRRSIVFTLSETAVLVFLLPCKGLEPYFIDGNTDSKSSKHFFY